MDENVDQKHDATTSWPGCEQTTTGTPARWTAPTRGAGPGLRRVRDRGSAGSRWAARKVAGMERSTTEDLVRRYQAGESIRAIAGATGVAATTVHRRLVANRVELRPPGRQPSALERTELPPVSALPASPPLGLVPAGCVPAPALDAAAHPAMAAGSRQHPLQAPAACRWMRCWMVSAAGWQRSVPTSRSRSSWTTTSSRCSPTPWPSWPARNR
jgi:Helix-turn-helix domain